MDVVVLEVDSENRRLSLGHKQLEENPWDVFETIFTVGSLHEGTVISVNEKSGAVVNLPYGIEGFCPKGQMQKEDKTSPKVDEKLQFKVIEFQKEAKRIVLSHTRTWKQEEETKSKKEANPVRKINQSLEKTTLGDLDVLASLKEEMEKKEN